MSTFCYRHGMTSSPPERTSHSPNAERLRAALGWDRLPEMTSEQREAYDAANERARADARRFYGDPEGAAA
jgi:hypothetical protein